MDLQRQLFHGLSDRSRLAILSALKHERRVSEVVTETGLSQPNVSKHLACLWGCGLVSREKRGREVYYSAIDGIDELLAASARVLEIAGETVGSCPLTTETVSN